MKTADKNPILGIVVPETVKELLAQIASEREQMLPENEKRRVYPSDIAREAIEAYLNELGYDIKVEVDRGGDRTKPED